MSGKCIFVALLGLMLCTALLACTASRNKAAPSTLLRADPAYVQWLERQSMLGSAPQLTSLISGTEKSWRAPSVDTATGRDDRIATLLDAAPTWLWVDAPSLITARMRPLWLELATPEFAGLVDALGLRGLYVAATAESGGIWGHERRQSLLGDDATSLYFAPYVGTDEQFTAFSQAAARRNWQLGADLAPAATGLGPDFFLAARQVRDYPGAFMMVEVPENLWPALPATATPWEVSALTSEQHTLMVGKGLLPPLLARDSINGLTPGGWAVTGEVRGADGVNRRWLYRYHRAPERPQLQWDDPSGAARKIFSASIIRQVGLLQHTLVGVGLEPLVGLDPLAEALPNASPTLEPAPSALRDLGRETRRYGGWLAQWDTLEPEAVSAGADFYARDTLGKAARDALQSSDAALVRGLLAEAAQSDQRRVLRQITGKAGPGLLAEALPASPTEREELARKHSLLTLFQGGLPGLLFLSGQDVAGSLADKTQEKDSPHNTGWSWYLPLGSAHSRQGTARAATLYALLPEQWNTPESYAHTVRKLTQARQKYGLARAQMWAPARTVHTGSAGFWLTLPQGDKALVLANFSAKSVQERISLPAGLQGAKGAAWDMLNERAAEISSAANELTVTLAPHQCLWLGFAR